MLRFSVRSHFRMWIRWQRDQLRTKQYTRELCGFNSERWLKHYGKTTFGNGIKEIFSKA